MQIRRLPAGEIAPSESDCIKITKLENGRFELATSALMQCDDEEEVSEAILSGAEYDSYEQAEAAGLAWAEDRCVEIVYLESA